MNGRVYDPLLGRMLSSDAFVQNPSSTQSFSRYSYVMNNPLKYSDPTGMLSALDVCEYLWEQTPYGANYSWNKDGLTHTDLGPIIVVGGWGGVGVTGYTARDGGGSGSGGVVTDIDKNKDPIEYAIDDFLGIGFHITTNTIRIMNQSSSIMLNPSVGFSQYPVGNNYKIPGNEETSNGRDKSKTSDDERPIIKSPYGSDCESSSSWKNFLMWLNYLDHRTYGSSNQRPDSPTEQKLWGITRTGIEEFAKINPLVSFTNGVNMIVTGQNISGQNINSPITQGLYSIISGVTGLNNLTWTFMSMSKDQVIPLIIDKSKLP